MICGKLVVDGTTAHWLIHTPTYTGIHEWLLSKASFRRTRLEQRNKEHSIASKVSQSKCRNQRRTTEQAENNYTHTDSHAQNTHTSTTIDDNHTPRYTTQFDTLTQFDSFSGCKVNKSPKTNRNKNRLSMVEGWKSLFDTNIENHRPNQKMIKQLKSLQHEKLRILSSSSSGFGF